jgi:hypothetical protein
MHAAFAESIPEMFSPHAAYKYGVASVALACNDLVKNVFIMRCKQSISKLHSVPRARYIGRYVMHILAHVSALYLESTKQHKSLSQETVQYAQAYTSVRAYIYA